MRTRNNRQSLYALMMTLAALLPTGVQAAPSVVRAIDGATLTEASATEQAPLLIRLAAGDAIAVFGHRVSSVNGGQVYVVLSSDYTKWAVIAGDVRVDKMLVAPGAVALTPIASGATLVRPYDASRLAASAPPGIASAIAAALDPVAQTQRHDRFFGALASSPLASSPAAAAREKLRRSYLADPAVVALRIAAGGDASALRRDVASHFAVALSKRDRTTVSALLDPAPFLSAGGGWRDARSGFATQLVAQMPPADHIAVQPDGDDARIEYGAQVYRLRLVMRGDTPFVAALEPVS